MDGRTPVLVGVGQVADSIDSPDYAALSTAQLAAAAADLAIADTGGSSSTIRDLVDALVCIRPFEFSGPSTGQLGRPINFARAVAHQVRITPARAVFEVAGGQSPQHAINEFAREIAAGRHDAVVITGAGAQSTLKHFELRADRPDHSDAHDGPVEDRGADWQSFLDDNMLAHALFIMPASYGLAENARRLRLGLDSAAYRLRMAELFAPFTDVAAKNPLAAVRESRTAAELAEITDANPLIWDPYPKRMIAREKVNQGAGVLLMSIDAARACHISQDRWVYLHGQADLTDLPFLQRPDLGTGEAATQAVLEALRVAGVEADDLETLDLYSCFPVPVFTVCDGLGLSPVDSRGLTVTGGLPFFGGPDNNYSMHAVVETVIRSRERPGSLGLVGANGGVMSKYSAGIYSTTPQAWKADRSDRIQARQDQRPRVLVTRHADGPARIETYSMRHGTDPSGSVLVARLDSDQTRCLAYVEDPRLLDMLKSGDVHGCPITVTSDATRGANVAMLG